ncbi:MAG: DNA repair protein RecN [Lachnospiraceae bacterium]|jgi:DNA repair protein RecN (Recombination protein N)
MITGLHVRNLALIEEEEVTFTDGLNILTGETGAGKSIIIGSIGLALGAKADRSMIRTGCDFCLIEMTFSLDNDRQRKKLEEMDIEVPEDGILLIKRKVYPNRTTCQIQGESVTVSQLRDFGSTLIDVYGQRENQRLLAHGAQLKTLDDYAGDEDAALRAKIREHYRAYMSLKKKMSEDIDAAARLREIDLLTYEVQEIEDADLKKGEDAELEEKYKKLSNFQRITAAAGEAGSLTSDEDGSASSQIERALRELNSVQGLDADLDAITGQLSDIDSLLSDFQRSLSDYMDSLSFDPQEFSEIESRLNLINHLKEKYGNTFEKIQNSLAKRKERLLELSDYDAAREKMKKDLAREKEALSDLCHRLTALRKKAADAFTKDLTRQLLDLNFNQVSFQVDMKSGEEYLSSDGEDEVTFLISMNPGEAPRPLEKIASGGELSRIMLALKTVFAGQDDIHSFIFDEIDAGISGQTAWKVSEKLGNLAKDHQILCITHLPQIAAMEDSHYRIEKHVEGERTVTGITRLDEDASLKELGRLLGGAKITEATLTNAREMKRMAKAAKEQHKEG